jgi:hypothetical protein
VAALRRAYHLAVDLQTAPLLAELDLLAQTAHVPTATVAVPQEAAGPIPGLTPRGREVLAHLAAGRTNGEIARPNSSRPLAQSPRPRSRVPSGQVAQGAGEAVVPLGAVPVALVRRRSERHRGVGDPVEQQRRRRLAPLRGAFGGRLVAQLGDGEPGREQRVLPDRRVDAGAQVFGFSSARSCSTTLPSCTCTSATSVMTASAPWTGPARRPRRR